MAKEYVRHRSMRISRPATRWSIPSPLARRRIDGRADLQGGAVHESYMSANDR